MIALAADPGVHHLATHPLVLALPGVARFVEPEVPAGALQEVLCGAVSAAVEALDAMRVAEGAALEREVLGQ